MGGGAEQPGCGEGKKTALGFHRGSSVNLRQMAWV